MHARLSQAVKEPVKAIHLECCVTGVYIIIIIMQQLPLFAGSSLSLSSTDVFETYPIHSLFKAISLKINCGTGSRGQQRFFCYMISLGRSACLPACLLHLRCSRHSRVQCIFSCHRHVSSLKTLIGRNIFLVARTRRLPFARIFLCSFIYFRGNLNAQALSESITPEACEAEWSFPARPNVK
jgi:hypothetical protein